MNIWLIIIALGAGWAIGPLTLQVIGGGLVLITLLLLATAQPLGWAAALVLGGGGALIAYVGFHWKVARMARYPTAVGVKARELAAGLILRRDPHSGPRRWLARRMARALGPIQADGILRHAQARSTPGPRRTRLRTLWAARSRMRAGKARARSGRYTETEDWIVGTAHKTDGPAPGAEEREAAGGQRLRQEVDRVLEEARDCLERIVWALFVNRYEDWPDRLTEHRRQRRPDLPPIESREGSLHDRRLLFSVIAYDWPLIAYEFKRDPSPAARKLCAIANRYAHEGPLDTDPAGARQAFGEILAALRPQAIRTAKGFMKHSRPLAHR